MDVGKTRLRIASRAHSGGARSCLRNFPSFVTQKLAGCCICTSRSVPVRVLARFALVPAQIGTTFPQRMLLSEKSRALPPPNRIPPNFLLHPQHNYQFLLQYNTQSVTNRTYFNIVDVNSVVPCRRARPPQPGQTFYHIFCTTNNTCPYFNMIHPRFG